MQTTDLQTFIYDKNLRRVGTLGDPIKVSGSLLQTGTGGALTYTVNGDDPNMSKLIDAGCRIGVRLRGVDVLSGMRGPVSGSLLGDGNVQFSVTSDRSLLQRVLAWPNYFDFAGPFPGGVTNPANNGLGTRVPESGYFPWIYQFWYTDTAIAQLLSMNLLGYSSTNPFRFNLPVTIFPTNNAGRLLTADELPPVRFATLDEVTQAVLDVLGTYTLGAVQAKDATKVGFTLRAGRTWPAVITAASGIIQGGTWTMNPPSATRVVLGGPGEDVHRLFDMRTETTGLEGTYGPLSVAEVFKDATGVPMVYQDGTPQTVQDEPRNYFTQPTTYVLASDKTAARAYFSTQATVAFNDGKPSTSVSATLSETSSFRFGGTDGIQLGDTLSFQASNGITFTETLTEAQIDYTPENGLVVTPIVGDVTNNPDRKLADKVLQLARAQSRANRNR